MLNIKALAHENNIDLGSKALLPYNAPLDFLAYLFLGDSVMDSLQNIAPNLLVCGLRGLRTVCAGMQGNFSDVEEDYIERKDILAILSIEHDENREDQNFFLRLSPELTAGIERHYTELFYVDEKIRGGDRIKGVMDLFASERAGEEIVAKAAALAQTLEWVDAILDASGKGDKKLVVHCIQGIHRSAALMAGILAWRCPGASGDDIMEVLTKVSVHAPQLRPGELAFIDAFLGRDGELAKAWHKRSGGRFDLDNALIYCNRFSAFMSPQQFHQAPHKRDPSAEPR